MFLDNNVCLRWFYGCVNGHESYAKVSVVPYKSIAVTDTEFCGGSHTILYLNFDPRAHGGGESRFGDFSSSDCVEDCCYIFLKFFIIKRYLAHD